MTDEATVQMLRLAAIDECVNLAEQSLAATRAEGDDESAWVKASIAGKQHIIGLLTAYRDREYVRAATRPAEDAGERP